MTTSSAIPRACSTTPACCRTGSSISRPGSTVTPTRYAIAPPIYLTPLTESKVISLLLVNSDNASAATLASIFQAAQIASYGYAPASTTSRPKTWPTLSTLISQNKRLVTFIASLDPANNTVAPYLLDEFTFLFENSYHNDNASAYSCALDRPSGIGDAHAALAKGYLPLTNHFRYDSVAGIEISAPEDADSTNADTGAGSLGVAADACRAAYARNPVFLLTDFSNVGPAVAVADRLNGVAGATSGRRALPTTVAGTVLETNKTMTTEKREISGARHVRRSVAGRAREMRRETDERLTALASVLAAGGAAAFWMGR